MSLESQIYELTNKLYEMEQNGEGNIDQQEYENLLKEISEKDPLNYIFEEKYAQILVSQGKIDQAQKVYEKALRYNAAQVELWKRFTEFALENYYIKNQEEEKTKQIYERAIDNVGNHMKAGELWLKYADFELMQNHMGFMNLLLYLALKTPLLDADQVEKKQESFLFFSYIISIRYIEILETLFDTIVEDMQSEGYTIGEKYKQKHEELVKIMFEECQGDKFEFINKLKVIAAETKNRVEQRIPYERKIMQIWEEQKSLDEEKDAWLEYIEYEINQSMNKRAKLLYERGLISLDRDLQFFFSYLRFLDSVMKDPTMVRAKFEMKLKHCDKLEVVDIMLENAAFEEEQINIIKARKIYEQINNEIAPDYIKAIVFQINFEKRQNNIEKVKELYFKSYTNALNTQNLDSLTYISMQYARFLTIKCQEHQRAIDILNGAISKLGKKVNKTYYLSYVNFLKHIDMSASIFSQSDLYAKVCQIFEKALEEGNLITNDGALKVQDRYDLAKIYLEYVYENANSISIIRTLEQQLKQRKLIYISNKKIVEANDQIQEKKQITIGGGEESDQLESVLGKRDRLDFENNNQSSSVNSNNVQFTSSNDGQLNNKIQRIN